MFQRLKNTLTGKKAAPPPKVWRQGDVFIIETEAVPAKAAPCRPVLAEGEVTGHAHRLVTTEGATVLGHEGQLFLRVTSAAATVEHEEHAAVTIPRGNYIVRIQREYHPKEIRRVVD